MIGTKRKASGPVAVRSKRAGASPPSPSTASLTEDELTKFTKAELIQHALTVQRQRDDAVLQRDNAPGPKAYSPEDLDDMMKQARKMLVEGIERLMMKWTPSCKTGTARFTYECQVSSPYIYKLVLGLPSGHNKKKFKMSVSDFHNTVGRPKGKVRHNVLVITGSDVSVRWMPDESIYKISGTFGKPSSVRKFSIAMKLG
ncbi:hypothetical protein BU25DRAFT_407188 [Macroventuria anomochaeta]|uniref:Uncharacterized protein n=1 Tax=Macroventuria anomochaeta TaxID=301207 RepID=A0ACB6SB74_9PLEO|nr:uncharacterized protein BU25DRAFT_407188 [Macroventuria anomochaeta]KAF2631536.1 hypothetical protein BU25DRAFT_407188 [Macroventuria anomochaeta]